MRTMIGRTLVVAIAACSSLSTAVLEAQRPGKLPVVPLVVTVQPVDLNFNPTRMAGDGRDYIDGQEGVVARLTEFGGLYLDFQSAGSQRRVFFDYSDPLDPSNVFQPAAEPVVYSGLRTTLGSSNIAIQQMPVGTAQCIAMGTSYDLSGGISFRNHYRRPAGTIDVGETSFVMVARIDATTWEAEASANLCSATAPGLARLVEVQSTKKSTTTIDHGLYGLSFRLTLTPKP